MMDAFERALAVPKRRPYWKKRAIAFAFVLAGLVALALVAFASLGLESVAAAIPPSAPLVPEVASGSSLVDAARGVGERVRLSFDHVLALSCFFGLAVSGVAVFYRFAVETSSRRRRVWPGATLAIVLWLVISWAFGAYVGSLGQYTLYYGSLAAVAVVLVWLWLTSLALLIGAELNAQLEGTRI
jgi:membrane protein